jgi:hypothetical protein
MIVTELTNSQLVFLSKEISTMSNLDKPSEHKRSFLLNEIWKFYKLINFHDTFISIKHTVKAEIIHRINTDKMKLI